MAGPWDRHNPPRLVGYESWLYQKPCIDSSGDVFVSTPLPGVAVHSLKPVFPEICGAG
jgi:hypothetical protein